MFNHISRPEYPEASGDKEEERGLSFEKILLDSSLNHGIHDDEFADEMGHKPPVVDEHNNGVERLRNAGEISI